MSQTAMPLPNADLSRVDSVSGGSSALSVRRREFARHFVLTGGNSAKAAMLAGYSDSDPHKAAQRALLDPKVLAEVKRLSMVNVGQWLPFAIQVLVDIAADPANPPRDRIAAANSLLDRAGMAAPKGGVQVNVGVQVGANEVQTLIGSIWSAKDTRMSDIGSGMSDSAQIVESAHPAQIERPALDGLEPIGDLGRGGVQFQGPPPVPSNIPPSPHTEKKSQHNYGDSDPFAGYVANSTAREEDDDGRQIRISTGSRGQRIDDDASLAGKALMGGSAVPERGSEADRRAARAGADGSGGDRGGDGAGGAGDVDRPDVVRSGPVDAGERGVLEPGEAGDRAERAARAAGNGGAASAGGGMGSDEAASRGGADRVPDGRAALHGRAGDGRGADDGLFD